jgi:indolepyruvate ferredoxin oxidoreductase
MLGFGWQRGLIPLSATAIDRAIELNEVAVDSNKRAFLWGRRAAVDLAKVQALAQPKAKITSISVSRNISQTLDELIVRRAEFLTDYQNAAYAEKYLSLVKAMRIAEQKVNPSAQLPLSKAVATYAFKLMAYKDEYEVARLYSNGQFQARLNEVFEGNPTLKFHLAPPLLSKKNSKGELIKSEYGPWILKAFGVLARFKGLRGGPLDIFGRTEERRMERQLIVDYSALVNEVISLLSSENHGLALSLLSLPEQLRGFGHVKERHLKVMNQQWGLQLAQLRAASEVRSHVVSQLVPA